MMMGYHRSNAFIDELRYEQLSNNLTPLVRHWSCYVQHRKNTIIKTSLTFIQIWFLQILNKLKTYYWRVSWWQNRTIQKSARADKIQLINGQSARLSVANINWSLVPFCWSVQWLCIASYWWTEDTGALNTTSRWQDEAHWTSSWK